MPEPEGDVIADVYHGRRQDPDTQRAGRERIHWMCSKARGDRVLDIGCSQGIACLLLAREGVHCVGVDTRADAVAYARAEAAKEPPAVRAALEYRQADGMRLDFEDESFDCVLLGEVVEHLLQPERILAEAARVLKPGGAIVVTTPFGYMPDPDHKQTFFFSSFLPLMERFFRTEGFEVLARRYIGYLGSKEAPGHEAEAHAAAALRQTEQACLAQQQRSHERVEALRRELRAAALRHRRTLHTVEALHRQRRNAEAAGHGFRRKHQAAMAQVEQLAAELDAMQATRAWHWTLRVRRLRAELLHGTWGQRALYLRDIAGKALGRRGPEPPPPLDEAAFEPELEAFLHRAARAGSSDRFVVIFSGTGPMQEHRGNRPMRLAAAMRRRGIPVLFSYYRTEPAGPIPRSPDPLLFQSPIDRTIAAMGRIARRDLGPRRKVFLISFPHLACARWVDELAAQGWSTVYEARDDWEEFAKVGLAPWYDERVERYLVAHADAACAVSRPLQEKLQAYARNKTVCLSPNAYDTEFLSARNAGRVAPRGGRPVLGYFGYLTRHWFDWEALLEMARRKPEWTFELIGDHAPADLAPPPNVRLLGLRTHSEINGIAQRWRVAIIPFTVNALTRAVDPIKIYEYLALGLPVVSFTMPQIEGYPYTATAPDVDGFLERAREAMAMPVDRGAIERFLAENRWEDRLDQLLALADAAQGRRAGLWGLAQAGGAE